MGGSRKVGQAKGMKVMEMEMEMEHIANHLFFFFFFFLPTSLSLYLWFGDVGLGLTRLQTLWRKERFFPSLLSSSFLRQSHFNLPGSSSRPPPPLSAPIPPLHSPSLVGSRSGAMSSRTTSPRQPAGTSTDPAAVKRDLERLERSRRMIQAHISDAEKRGTVGHLESLRPSELRGLALDEWKYELVRAEAEGGGARKRKPGEDSSCDPAARILAGDPSLRDRMARQIDGIMRRYDEIVSQGGAFRWGNWDGQQRRGHSDRALSGSLVDEGYVFDREDDKHILVDYLLTDGCATSKLSVIPIVGMGPMGKTTLVQLVYGDPKVKQNFHLMVWVSLRDSDLMSLLRSVVESVTSKPCGHSQLNPIQTILQRCLKGKRLLLALDDVYREHLHFWDMVKSSIGSCSQGSVVLITTKIGEVAERTKTVEAPFYLFDSISDDSCRLLFKKYASVGQDSTIEGPGMEGICKKVTEICEGMPLVAKLLGISFRNCYSRENWVDSMEDVIEKKILPKLESSYQLLPEHLKPCLLYCSLFSKG